MKTKETFLSLAVGASYQEMADQIDFDALDSFVAMFITTYINRRGREIVKRELSADALSETTTFLTRMVDVGTVQFLSENHLISFNVQKNSDLATVVAHSINISMAAELKRNSVDEPGSNIFFGIPAVYDLIARVIDHIRNSLQEDRYIFSLVSANLMGLVNRTPVE